MVFELVTANGATSPGAANYNGATNFVVGKLEENGAQATAMTAKVFLGLQVQCTQCHNHPFNEWKQQKFWEMNAFFARRKPFAVRPRHRDVESGEPSIRTLPVKARAATRPKPSSTTSSVTVCWKNARFRGRHRHQQERLSVGLRPPFERQDDSQVRTDDHANRTWAHFLGYGFTRPVDDMGPHNPPRIRFAAYRPGSPQDSLTKELIR
jgi:hypothetical protein